RREGRRRGERAAEGSELALGLGEAEVIEAARRLGALPVVEARLVVGPHLGKRRLAEGPGGGGAHAVESGGRGSAEVGAQDASHARPFRLEGGLAPALVGRALAQVGGRREARPRLGEALERQLAPAGPQV